MRNSKIEWTDNTFNPWYGCTKVSPACDHCYAEMMMATRYGKVKWGAGQARVRTKDWDKPRKWDREAARAGIRQKVFCASLADAFDAEVPQAWRDELWELIGDCSNLNWQLLTKRPASIMGMVPPVWREGFPDNVWVGTTIENRQWAQVRLPAILKVPARVKFISAEPLLEAFEIPRGIDWVIVGGESGPGWRALSLPDVRRMRDQCQALGIPFFFKQHSGFSVKALGRDLDGREHNEFPRM
jgi:protein gp37